MRNSSLDEWRSAEDITELKSCTEVEDAYRKVCVVGERAIWGEAISRGMVDYIVETMLA